MQMRFDSLGSFVKAVAEEQRSTEVAGRLREPLSSEQLAFIQLLAFVYSLTSFLRDGSRAAREAASVFESLGMTGFTVGEAIFTERNENTARGDALASGLADALVGTACAEVLTTSRSMTELISRLVRELSRG